MRSEGFYMTMEQRARRIMLDTKGAELESGTQYVLGNLRAVAAEARAEGEQTARLIFHEQQGLIIHEAEQRGREQALDEAWQFLRHADKCNGRSCENGHLDCSDCTCGLSALLRRGPDAEKAAKMRESAISTLQSPLDATETLARAGELLADAEKGGEDA